MKNKESGLTLLESLVAIIVLSIGVLGAAALHLSFMSSAHASLQRAIATLAAQDMSERLWSEMVASDDVSVCPTISEINSTGGVFSDWLVHWSGEALPGLDRSEIVASSQPCQYELRVKWLDERFGNASGEVSLIFVASVPEFG